MKCFLCAVMLFNFTSQVTGQVLEQEPAHKAAPESTQKAAQETSPKRATNDASGLKKSLTFYASFDNGLNADFANGDKQLYSVTSQKEVKTSKPGTALAPQVVLAPKQGRNGGAAIHFKKKTSNFVFFKAEKNVVHSDKNWSGTFSFWLKVDPVSELAPGFTDPIQLTDSNYDDAAIWVDFTKKNPRKFRLGMKCDKEAGQKNDKKTQESRVSAASTLPFSGDAWTQVVITFSGLNTDGGEGRLYFDGVEQATVTNIDDPFTWNLSEARIRLGLGFTGMIDEIAAFDRAFTAEEVKTFYKTDMAKMLKP